MGMFDWYEPVPALACPRCRIPLSGWQGTAGLCGLFRWRQGVPAPSSDFTEEEFGLPQSEVDEQRLPDGRLTIYARCETCDRMLLATARVESGTWKQCDLEMPENMRPFSWESEREFRTRRARLTEFVNGEPVGSRPADDD